MLLYLHTHYTVITARPYASHLSNLVRYITYRYVWHQRLSECTKCYKTASQATAYYNMMDAVVMKVVSVLLVGLALVTSVLANPISHNPISARNITATHFTDLNLRLAPTTTSLQCGQLTSATISVQYADDEFYLSEPCQAFLSLIGGMHGSQDADVLFMCADGNKFTSQGTDSNNGLKLVFFTTSKGPGVVESAKGLVSATMQVTWLGKLKKPLPASVTLVGQGDATHGYSFGSLVCE